MSVQFRIPRILEKYSSGKTEFGVDGATVGDVLMNVKHQFPPVYSCICDETGKVRRHIHLFVNDRLLVGDTALKTRLESGDIISVFQAVSGG